MNSFSHVYTPGVLCTYISLLDEHSSLPEKVYTTLKKGIYYFEKRYIIRWLQSVYIYCFGDKRYIPPQLAFSIHFEIEQYVPKHYFSDEHTSYREQVYTTSNKKVYTTSEKIGIYYYEM
jgi:hypothetical protein